MLPQFRGSTTIYYSILSKSKIGCSVLILDEEIDKGPVLYNREYDILEQNIDFDYVLDPLLRAKTLIKFLKSNEIKPIKQIDDGHQTTFYIIHPLLKHISILKHNTINR